MIGRTAGLLVELPVDLQPSGWRLVDRPGRDAARTSALIRGDLDELAEAFDGYAGSLKVQVVGPWTMAAQLRVHRGERVLVDAGAVRELTMSLAAGVAVHLDAVQRLVPGAELVLQIDEPMLPDVLAGELATSSGFGRLPVVDPAEARRGLSEVVGAAGGASTVVHCCAPLVPLPLLRQSGVNAVALDTSLLGVAGWESVAATIEAGVALWAGVIRTGGSHPFEEPGRHDHHQRVEPLVRAWRAVGLPVAGLNDVVLTPACGLTGWSPQQARAAQQGIVDAAGALTALATA